MTYGYATGTYPDTEDVMHLYEEINAAHTSGAVREGQWERLVAAAAEAETGDQIRQVRNDLKECTTDALE